MSKLCSLLTCISKQSCFAKISRLWYKGKNEERKLKNATCKINNANCAFKNGFPITMFFFLVIPSRTCNFFVRSYCTSNVMFLFFFQSLTEVNNVSDMVDNHFSSCKLNQAVCPFLYQCMTKYCPHN